jgi:co-chaperonin GroES (HSP10)
MIRDLVLLKVDPDPETGLDPDAESPIVMPEAHQRLSCRAEVIAVGPGIRTKKGFKATTLRRGDRVGFQPGAGMIFGVDGVEHRILPEGDIDLVFA